MKSGGQPCHNMMMIDKVKKYLLRHDEINVYKKNCSGSEYYRVGNSIIRVSDHIPISNNQPDVLNIVVSGDNFVVMYGNKIINVNDYNEFKAFLKYHIKMCDCFKDIINAGLGRQSNDYIARESKKTKKERNEEDLVLTLPIITGLRTFNYKGEEFDVSDLTDKQVLSLNSLFSNGSLSKRESLIKVLNYYRKQNK